MLAFVLVLALASMALAASPGCNAVNAGGLNYSGPSQTAQLGLVLAEFYPGDQLYMTHTTDVAKSGVALTLIFVTVPPSLGVTLTGNGKTHTLTATSGFLLTGAQAGAADLTALLFPRNVVLTVTCTAAPTPTTLAVTSTTNPSVFGQVAELVASVSALDGTATGSVVFTIDGVAQAPVALNGSGVAKLNATGLSVGSHTVSASYAGNSGYTASSGVLAGGQTVNKAATQTSVSSSALSSSFGSSVTFTATVAATAPGTGTPTGSVIFTVDGVDQPSATLNGAGVATLSTSALSVANHSVSARYVTTTNYAASSGSLAGGQAVVKAPTVTTVTQSSPTTTFGQPVTFEASVLNAPVTPTGSVIFSIDGAQQAPVTLVAGKAQLVTSTLAVGNHVITASYAGTPSLDGSSGTLSGGHTVNVISTTTSVSGPGAVVFGTSAAITASVTPASGTATGNVVFTVDNVAQAPIALSAGTATLTLSGLSAGTHSVSAEFLGSTNYGGSSGTLAGGQLVTKATTTTTISPIASIALGQSMSLAATVSGTPATPTGTVTFTVGGVAQSPVTLVNGQANLLVPNLAVGTYAVVAQYSGAGNFAASSANASGTVGKAASGLVVNSSANPAVAGQGLSFTATAGSSVSSPTGTVTFTIDTVDQAPIALSGGTATLNLPNLPVGNHAVSAVYSGDANLNSSSASLPGGQTVARAATTVSLSSDSPTPALGATVIFSATVAPVAPGAGTPTGNIVFSIDGVAQAPVALSGGNATLTRSNLGVGNHAITALYVGDGNFTSSSGTLSGGQDVTAAATSTQLNFAPASPTFGSAATLTATVTSSGGTPAGDVIFTVNGTDRPATSLVNGTASLVLPNLAVGSYTLGARFIATANYLASAASDKTMIVAAAATTTSVSANPASIRLGESTTLSTTVVSASGTPSGTVEFRADGNVLGTATLSSGAASLSTSALTRGDHAITVNYLGSTNHAASTGTLATVLPVLPGTTTLVASATPAPSTYGQTVTLKATASAISGTPSGSVIFTVGGVAQPAATLTGGVATLPVSGLEPGIHTVSVSYAGSANHDPATTSIPGGIVVNKATPTLTVGTSPASPVFGAAVTVTATLASGAGTPTGNVTFIIDGIAQTPAVAPTAGVAELTLPALGAGTHSVEARCAGDAHFSSVNTVVPGGITVAAAATSMALDATPDPARFGDAVTISATLTSLAGTPDGSVVFTIDGQAQTPVTLSNLGIATLTTSGLTVGPHTVSAAYAAHGNFAASSATLGGGIEIDVATTTTTLQGPVGALLVGDTAHFTATITADHGTSTGAVVFTVDGVARAPVALVNGVATRDEVFTTAGAHTVTATYTGAANFAPSSASLLAPLAVGKASSDLVVSLAANSEYGATLSVSALATSSGGTPTGTVIFYVDSQQVGSGILSAGTATLSLPPLSAGTHTITAAYAGDLNFGPAIAPDELVNIAAAATTATITAMPTSVSEGEPVTFAVTVRADNNNAPATGTAIIKIGATNYPVTLVNGAASLVLGDLAAASYPVRVDYAAQGNFGASFDVLVGNLVVAVPPTDIHVQASLPRAVSGTAYAGSFTAFGGTPFTPPAAPYHYAVTAGALPAGLSLNGDTGAISGTLGAAGTYNWTITATAAAGLPGVYPAQLVVLAPATITLPATLPDAIYGVNFNQSVAATGGTAPLAYTVSLGALPQGVLLNAATGALTGAPTQLGNANFIITATDTNGFTGTQAYTVPVIAPTITVSGTFANGTVNTPYSATISVTGGATPRSFTADGTLPPGLSVNAGTGALAGTPITAGTYTFGIIATDANGFTGRIDATVDIVAQPVIVLPTTLAVPRQNRPYSQALAAAGGTPPYAYAISSGALPPGLGINSTTGRISGTPTSSGSYTFEVTATDATTLAGAHSYTLNVQPAAVLVVDTNVGPITAGLAVDKTIGVTGGRSPYAFTILSGSLPTGISLDPVTGKLSGSSLALGTYSLVLEIADADGDTVIANLNLQVVAPVITVTASVASHDFGDPTTGSASASGGTAPYKYTVTAGALPNGVVIDLNTGVISGTSTVAGTFNAVITATGVNLFTGSTPVSFTITAPTLTLSTLPANFMLGRAVNTSLVVGNGTAPYDFVVTGNLPAGLTLDPTSGALTGTPTTLGMRSFTVTVTDDNGFVVAGNYTVEIVTNIGDAVLPGALPPVTAGLPYAASVAATGGATPLAYAVTTGSLPTGLGLDPATGAITGTTVSVGSFPITVTVTGADGRINTAGYTLVVSAPTMVASGTLDAGVAGTAYSDTIDIAGGKPTYGVVLKSGALPTGLLINAAGVVSGTPTVAGTFSFTVTVTDANNFSSDITYGLTIAAPSIVLSSNVPAGRVGQVYAGSITATGGVPTRTFAVTTGTLPDGLSLSGAGILSGTPTAAGSTTVTITATDGNGFTAARTFEFVIASNLGNATLGALDTPIYRQAYSDTVAATGGTAPFGYAVTIGTLPLGLSLDATTGAVTGTPTVTGNFSFTITATDNTGLINQNTYNLTIAPPVITVTVTPPAGRVGVAYAPTIVTAAGGRSPYVFALADEPLGISINSGTGVISGTPQVQGTYNVSVTATDADGFSASPRVTMVIGAAPLALNLPASLPNGVTATPYSASLVPNNAVGAVTYSVTGGSLPLGLALNTTSGIISGTPLLGTYSFDIRAVDSDGNVGTASYGITVALLPPLNVPTTIDLDASSTTAAVGETITVTAEVLTGSGHASNGLVTLRDTVSGAILGINAIGADGKTSFSISFGTTATRTLAADYSGGIGFAGSTVTGDTITVAAAPTAVNLTGTSGTIGALTPIVLVANVARQAPSSGAAGAGNIVFSVDGSDVLTVPAILGSGTYVNAGLTPGQHTIRARFVSTGGSDLDSFAERIITVTSPTLTILTAPLGDILFGQSPTFTATVTPVLLGVPVTGDVIFRDNGVTVATVPVSNGKAIHTLATPGLGLHLVTAEYVGDSYYGGSLALGLSLNVLSAPAAPINSTTLIVASDLTPQIGAPVTLTATVAANGIIIPTGLVTFYDDDTGIMLGSAVLDGAGVATLTLAVTDGDPITIRGDYVGDLLSQPSSGLITLTPVAAATDIELTAASLSVLPGDPVDLTAVVRRQAGGIVNAGTVVFLADGMAFAYRPSNGSTPITVTTDPVTSSTVFTAEFIPGPSSADSAAQSLPVTVTANQATPTIAASITVLPDGSAQGSVSVVPPSGVNRTPSGTVLLRAGLTLDQTLTLDNGAASFSYPPGSFSGAGANFDFDYSGDALFLPASANLFSTAAGALATQTQVTLSTNAAALGEPVTATIAVTASVEVEDGMVEVYDDGVLVSTVAIVDGAASVVLDSLDASANVITARYLGTLNYGASTSNPATVTVAQAPVGELGLTLAADSQALFSVGQLIEVTATISANGGAANNIAVGSSIGFSCPRTTLLAGESMTCTASYRVTNMDMSLGALDITVTVSADNLVPVTRTLSLRSEAATVSETFEKLSDNFVANRARVIGNAIKIPNILVRRSAQTGNRAGTVQASANPGGQTLSFTSSLAEWRSYAAAQAADGMALGMLDEPLPLNIWVDAQFALHASTGSDPSWGQVGTFAIGADYLVTDDFLAGVMIQGDWASESSGAGEVSGAGFLVGPYVSIALGEHLTFDATLLYGQSQNTASSTLFGETFSGDFDTTRLMAKGVLGGYFEIDELTVRPNVAFFLGSESIRDYSVTNADGDLVDVPGGDQLQYELTIGAKFEYVITLDDGATLTPMLGVDVGVSGNVNDDAPATQNIIGRVSAGVDYETEAGLIVGLEFSTELDSGGFSSAAIRASIKGRF